jgi:hypothetical protein
MTTSIEQLNVVVPNRGRVKVLSGWGSMAPIDFLHVKEGFTAPMVVRI